MNTITSLARPCLPTLRARPMTATSLVDTYCSNPWYPTGPSLLSRLAGGATAGYALGAVGQVAGAHFGPQGAALGLLAGGFIGVGSGWNAGFAKTVCTLFGIGVGFSVGSAVAGPAAGLVGSALGGLLGAELARQS